MQSDIIDCVLGSEYMCLSLALFRDQMMSVFQIAGPSGCGKTQLCTQLTLMAASQRCTDDRKAVLYIDTEAAFSPERYCPNGWNSKFRYRRNNTLKICFCLCSKCAFTVQLVPNLSRFVDFLIHHQRPIGTSNYPEHVRRQYSIHWSVVVQVDGDG